MPRIIARFGFRKRDFDICRPAAPRDYYLLPALDMTWKNLRVAEDNGIYLDAYRFDSLDYFFGMAKRCRIEEAA